MLDVHWAVNTRSVILLAQAYARRRPPGLPGGRIVLMTSGQDLGDGMPDEIAYGLAKGALASATRSLATTFADLGVTVNTVNPGPVDTGYAVGALREEVAGRFPGGRWGAPDDPARLIAWLTTDEGAWITGQVINSEVASGVDPGSVSGSGSGAGPVRAPAATAAPAVAADPSIS